MSATKLTQEQLDEIAELFRQGGMSKPEIARQVELPKSVVKYNIRKMQNQGVLKKIKHFGTGKCIKIAAQYNGAITF